MLREEMKKIWHPGMVLLLVILGFVFYSMFLEFYIRYFPNGPQARGVVDIGVMLIERYGTTLEPEEAEQLRGELAKMYEQADAYIREYEFSAKHGLKSYQEYEDFCNRSVTAALASEGGADLNEDYADCMRINNYLTSEATDNISGRIYAADWYLRRYEQAGRLYTKDVMWRNILPLEVPETVSLYMSYLLIWLCLSLCLLLSPVKVKDKMSRMEPLQYSTKKGRDVFKVQFQAVMLSAFLLVSVNLAVFLTLFASNGTKPFLQSRMFSFADTGLSHPDWSHGFWCLALVLISYLVAMGIAAATFFLSSLSGNYIAMLLKLLPVFVVTAIFCPKLLTMAFYYGNGLYRVTHIPYIEAIAAVFILGMGIFLCLRMGKRMKRMDVP